MAREDWDRRWTARLSEAPIAPNRFLVAEVGALSPGRALDLACGNGRNATWLAGRGWRVTGVDFSPVALDAARRMAGGEGVEIEWIEADLLSFEPEAEAFDLVVVLYLQIPPDERRLVLGRGAQAVAPGGTMLVVGHDSRNLEDGWGGPRDPRVLFTASEVAAQLAGLTVVRSERVTRPVSSEEGEHVALDALVRAVKPDRARG